MEPFEYFVVLSSLILGLGIAQILTSVADIVSHLKHVKLSLVHSLMVFNVFLMHVQEWWYSFQYIYEIKVWTLPLVLFLLTYPIFLFLLARMLFPTGLRSHETDLDEYYFDQWRWFYVPVLLIVISSFLQNVFVSGYEVSTQIPQFLMALSYTIFLTFGIKNKTAHLIFIAIQTVAWIFWTVLDPYRLVAGQ